MLYRYHNVVCRLACAAILVNAFGIITGTVQAQALQAPPTVVISGTTWVDVSTAAQLEYIDQNAASYLNQNIRLTANINLAGWSWQPLGGGATPFAGQFDGQSYQISGLSISGSFTNAGFFGVLDQATVNNVGIQGMVDITGTNAGILAGTMENNSTVSGVAASGTVQVPGGTVGGLIGNVNSGTVDQSNATNTSVTGGYAGGLIGNMNSGTLANVYATGTARGTYYTGGILGDLGGGSLTDAYTTVAVSGGYSGAVLGLYNSSTRPHVSGVYFNSADSSTTQAVGFNSTGGITDTPNLTSESTFSGWNWTSVWGINPALNSGTPYLQVNIASTPPSPLQVSSTTLSAATVGTAYHQTLTATGGTGTDSWQVQSGSTLPHGLTLSTGGVLSGTPATAGTNTFTVVVTDGSGATATQKLTLTVQAATPPSSPIPVWVPPVVTPHTVTIDGQTMQVIEGYGLNTGQAIANGTVAGFVEERSALASGVTLTGEGVDSSYLFSIMDGSGVGSQVHVSAKQQGQFAALYQKLGIIPTWTNNTVRIGQGVAALVKAGASTLAIENYLVQMDGASWAVAQAQARAGFPIQSNPVFE